MRTVFLEVGEWTKARCAVVAIRRRHGSSIQRPTRWHQGLPEIRLRVEDDLGAPRGWPAAGERVDSRPPGGGVRDPIRHRKATRAARAANALVDAAIYFERLCLVVRGKGVRVEAPGAID